MKKLFTLTAILAVLAWHVQAPAADVQVTHTMVNVTTSSAAASSRESRRLLVVVNMSDTAISCKFGATAVVSEGIVLNPQDSSGRAGGTMFFDVAVPLGALNCIHGGSGNKALSITEG